jgi:hypothetical protein
VKKLKYDRDSLQALEGGHTNQVFLTPEDTVLKAFQRYSLGSFLQFLGFLIVQGEFLGVSARISKEKELRERLPKQVEAPSIIDEGEGWIEMELVEEEFFSEKLEKGEDPKQLGVEVGKIMNTFEDADLYLADWAIKDIYNADGKIGVTDLEFGGENPNRLMRKMDRASVLLQTADSDNFKEFMEGLESEVALDYSTKILGFSMAFTYNLIYFWDEGRPAKVVRNGLKLHRET